MNLISHDDEFSPKGETYHPQSLFKELVDNSDDAILSVSLQGRILTFNKAAEKLFNYSATEILGQSVYQLVPAVEAKALRNSLQLISKGDHTEPYETVRMKRDGSDLYVSIRVSAIRSEDGALIGYSWILRDISAEKIARDLIRKLSSVVEQTADTVMITDKKGVMEYVNPAFCSTTGYRLEEVMGLSSNILKSGKHPQAFYQKLWETILAGKPFRSTMINRKKSGELFYTEKTITPLVDANGDVTHFVSTDKDVTDRELAQQELARSNEELRQFAAVASHDLQEPLRTMIVYLQLFARNNPSIDDNSQEHLKYVMDSASRLRDLIEDLLAFSSLTKQKSNLVEADVNKVVDEAIGNLKVAIESRNAVIHVEPLPRLRTDPQRLVQVFQNLIGNAIKYNAQKEPTVTISAKNVAGDWEFRVSDNGIGISEDYYHKIFEMFQRLHGREEFSGTGIGLAIVKKIVEQSGGKIWVESEVGKGSTFIFSLPAQ